MSKNNRDVKFIIYQVLYIFVIVVITMKGADLNLEKVLTEEDAVKKSYADSLKKYIDSMLALGLVPKIELDSLRNIADLKVFVPPQISPNMITLQTGQLVVSQEEFEKLKNQPELQQQLEQQQQVEMEKTDVTPLVAAPLIQYTQNTITNRGNVPLEIYGDDGSLIASIPAGGSRSFIMGGHKSVTYKQGGQSKTVSTRDNAKPEITFEQLKPGNSDASLRELQSVIGFRIRIKDDFLGQLDVKITGPVVVEDKGGGVFDVKLKYASSKEQFERMTENGGAPFRASFNVSVKDRISGHSIQRQGQYTFGEW
ncbi:MAG: hypothetical protein WC139_07630 [Candidatus Kapaibacterium sp.]